MSIRSHVEAAARAVVPAMTPAQLEKLGHNAQAFGGACLALSRGDESAMDDLYDGIEALIDLIENWPGPDRAGKAIAKSVGRGQAKKLRDKVHGND